MTKLYNAGIYTRLSVDDLNNSRKRNCAPQDESISIENQKLLLSKFVMLNGWIETKVYVDDGYSGGNFNRPGFKQMLEDAKSGVINLILVKDLSRFGRDYVEVGRYTDVVFPAMGIRFVSILDEIDTAKDDNDMLHIRSLMNDYHLRDLSDKVKAVLHAKARNGRFSTGRPTYGYTRSAEDKHLLIPEENAAAVVRKIYKWRVDGLGYTGIAGRLNAEGIPAPKNYWLLRAGKENKNPSVWMGATVKKILRCEAYIGTLVNGREAVTSYKNKRHYKIPESEWIRHENAHEPIIDRQTWDRVREIDVAAQERHAGRKVPEPSLFKEKLFCADCGGRLVSHPLGRRKNGGEWVRVGTNYSCYRHNYSGYKICTPHTISEIALKALILGELQNYAADIRLDETAMLNKLKRKLSLDDSEQQNLLGKEIKRLKQRISELERIIAELYEDKMKHKISEQAFLALMSKNETERQHKTELCSQAQDALDAINEKTISVSKWLDVLREHIHIEDLCRADIEELIDHIEIGESDYSSGKREQEVKIYWRFVGCLPS
jgi:DNA invertase Pin-like site-specific DNA recombinase